MQKWWQGGGLGSSRALASVLSENKEAKSCVDRGGDLIGVGAWQGEERLSGEEVARNQGRCWESGSPH